MESINGFSVDEAGARMQAIQSLVQQPGWALFVAAMQTTIAVAKDAGRRAESPHQMGFNFGAALAIEQALTWPMREVVAARELLKSAAEQK